MVLLCGNSFRWSVPFTPSSAKALAVQNNEMVQAWGWLLCPDHAGCVAAVHHRHLRNSMSTASYVHSAGGEVALSYASSVVSAPSTSRRVHRVWPWHFHVKGIVSPPTGRIAFPPGADPCHHPGCSLSHISCPFSCVPFPWILKFR